MANTNNLLMLKRETNQTIVINNCYMHSNANASSWRDTCRSPRQNKHMINSFINQTLILDKQNTNSGHNKHIEQNIYITNMNASV